jgi:hypothetical protein
MNALCGIHFAFDSIASPWQNKPDLFRWLETANSRGGFWVPGSGKQMSEFVIKENNHEAFLPRFGGGSGGYNYKCNDGMGATGTGNRHHNQRIRIW